MPQQVEPGSAASQIRFSDRRIGQCRFHVRVKNAVVHKANSVADVSWSGNPMLHLLSFEAGCGGVGSCVRAIQRLASGFAVRDRLSVCLPEELVDESFCVQKKPLPVALQN